MWYGETQALILVLSKQAGRISFSLPGMTPRVVASLQWQKRASKPFILSAWGSSWGTAESQILQLWQILHITFNYGLCNSGEKWKDLGKLVAHLHELLPWSALFWSLSHLFWGICIPAAGSPSYQSWSGPRADQRTKAAWTTSYSIFPNRFMVYSEISCADVGCRLRWSDSGRFNRLINWSRSGCPCHNPASWIVCSRPAQGIKELGRSGRQVSAISVSTPARRTKDHPIFFEKHDGSCELFAKCGLPFALILSTIPGVKSLSQRW